MRVQVSEIVDQVLAGVAGQSAVEQQVLRCLWLSDSRVLRVAEGADVGVAEVALVQAGVELGAVESESGSNRCHLAAVLEQVWRQSRVELDGAQVLGLVVDNGTCVMSQEQLLGVELDVLGQEGLPGPDTSIHTEIPDLIKSKPASFNRKDE